ncbi:MAG: hypothetical protein AAF734_01300, partial [Bacteroidota bacterium]
VALRLATLGSSVSCIKDQIIWSVVLCLASYHLLNTYYYLLPTHSHNRSFSPSIYHYLLITIY